MKTTLAIVVMGVLALFAWLFSQANKALNPLFKS